MIMLNGGPRQSQAEEMNEVGWCGEEEGYLEGFGGDRSRSVELPSNTSHSSSILPQTYTYIFVR